MSGPSRSPSPARSKDGRGDRPGSSGTDPPPSPRSPTTCPPTTAIWCSAGWTRSSPTRTSACWSARSTSGGGRLSRGRSRSSRALRGWLLDRVEDRALWFDRDGRPTPQSVAQLADVLDRDADFRSVLRLWVGDPNATTGAALSELLADEAVPFLAAYRLQGLRSATSGPRGRTPGTLQRREDAGEKLAGPIPVPPKYKPADFVKTSYWSAPRQARRAQGAVHLLPRRRPGHRRRPSCWAGPAGTTPSRRWRWRR